MGSFDSVTANQTDKPGDEPKPAKLTFFNEVAALFRSPTADQARRDEILTAGVKTARYRAQELFKDIRTFRAPAVTSIYKRYTAEAHLGEAGAAGAMSDNPLLSVPKDFFENAYRSWALEGGRGIPPWQRLGAAVKEGWVRDEKKPLAVHVDATDKNNARAMWRTYFLFEFMGLDEFCFYIPRKGEDNNVNYLNEALAPKHEERFLARANKIKPGMADQINAAIIVMEDKEIGGYNITPTPRFYELILQLTSTYFLENVVKVENKHPGLGYMRWNMGAGKYREFLKAVEQHMKEPENTAQIASEWAFQTKIKKTEWDKARMNALTFMFFSDVYQMVYENIDWKAKQ